MKSASTSVLLYLLFVVSGASGLVFEIVWVRALGVQLGTTSEAISTVIAAFMGGLALGSVFFGRKADRSSAPLALYQGIEFGIAVTGLIVSFLFLQGDAFFSPLARTIAGLGSAGSLIRFALVFALMLVPTTLMGATLPVVSRALVRAGTSGKVLGRLYGVNTIGAVAGALIPDLLAIPSVGLRATAALAAIGNLLVALLVSRVQIDEISDVPATPVSSRLPRAPLMLFAASGFCAMGYEVLWSRVLGYWSPSAVTSFSILLAIFLACLAIGALMAAPWADRVASPLAWAGTLTAATGCAAILPILAARPLWVLSLVTIPAGTRRVGGMDALRIAFVNAAYLETIACLLMGAAFPFLAAAVVRHEGAGHAAGRLYALNTVAGVAGSLATGFVLMPAFGVQTALSAIALAGSLVATAIVAARWRTSPRLAAASGVLCALLALSTIGADPAQLQTSYFPPGSGRILAIREGRTTTAAVAEISEFDEPAWLALRTPGVLMSATNFAARRYMGLMAHLPLFFSPRAEKALLICYGVGNTARSLLSHPTLERLDVVDLSREVLSLSPYFSRAHGTDPLRDRRTHVHNDDGRQFLITTSEMYDAITLEPPPPNDAGVVNLYTREFYKIAKSRLRPGGALSQWLPVFQLDEEDTRAIVAAFVAEFPHSALYYGAALQWILVGSNDALAVDLPRWETRAAAPSLRADLDDIGVAGASELAASLLQSGPGLVAATHDDEPLTDDLPLIAYPRHTLTGPLNIPGGMIQPPAPTAAVPDAMTERMTVTARLLPFYYMPMSEERELVLEQNARSLIGAKMTMNVLDLVGAGDERATIAKRAIDRLCGPAVTGACAQQHWQIAQATFLLARHAYYRGQFDTALGMLDLISPPPPVLNPAQYWFIRARVETALGHLDTARVSLEQSARASTSPMFTQAVRTATPVNP